MISELGKTDKRKIVRLNKYTPILLWSEFTYREYIEEKNKGQNSENKSTILKIRQSPVIKRAIFKIR